MTATIVDLEEYRVSVVLREQRRMEQRLLSLTEVRDQIDRDIDEWLKRPDDQEFYVEFDDVEDTEPVGPVPGSGVWKVVREVKRTWREAVGR